jgi:hypothetical protein
MFRGPFELGKFALRTLPSCPRSDMALPGCSRSLVVGVLTLAACTSGTGTSDSDSAATTAPSTAAAERAPVFRYPPAPEAPAADVPDAPDVRSAMGRLDVLLQAARSTPTHSPTLVEAAMTAPCLVRRRPPAVLRPGGTGPELVDAFESLTGVIARCRPRQRTQRLAERHQPPHRLGHPRLPRLPRRQGRALPAGRTAVGAVLRRRRRRHRLAPPELGWGADRRP